MSGMDWVDLLAVRGLLQECSPQFKSSSYDTILQVKTKPWSHSNRGAQPGLLCFGVSLWKKSFQPVYF